MDFNSEIGRFSIQLDGVDWEKATELFKRAPNANYQHTSDTGGWTTTISQTPEYQAALTAQRSFSGNKYAVQTSYARDFRIYPYDSRMANATAIAKDMPYTFAVARGTLADIPQENAPVIIHFTELELSGYDKDRSLTTVITGPHDYSAKSQDQGAVLSVRDQDGVAPFDAMTVTGINQHEGLPKLALGREHNISGIPAKDALMASSGGAPASVCDVIAQIKERTAGFDVKDVKTLTGESAGCSPQGKIYEVRQK